MREYRSDLTAFLDFPDQAISDVRLTVSEPLRVKPSKLRGKLVAITA
jgi:hypothetical protein